MNIFLDTETTGIDQEDRMIQLAYKTDKIEFNKLFKPDVRIKYRAMAVNHITEKMVFDKPTFKGSQDQRDLQLLFNDPNNILIAHNAAFDVSMLQKEDMIVPDKQICTRKCIIHLDQKAQLKSYSQQYLRYKLNLDIEGAIAHDAWGDILILEQLFNRLNKSLSIDEMLEISKNPALLPKINFGKYKYRFFRDVPKSYLHWLTEQTDMNEDILYTAQYWLNN